jgi:hypothetical protein
MYNPFGTIRSWISNALILHGAAKINGEYTLGYNVIIAHDQVHGLTDEEYAKAVNELIETRTTGIMSSVTMIMCSMLIAAAWNIHNHAYKDLCLETYRIYRKLSE